ncbi:hypothetical protein QJS04_geneDACA014751 [Acorus gramineus]|uniref:Uncharacterized protein n=1 Tax=Acorus gramineus TaxID=55184 RepID=A0AAV9BS63_ACOGR|nr:hypothetical protein QJS04_geneDACA014751 [Acorus gramineus]
MASKASAFHGMNVRGFLLLLVGVCVLLNVALANVETIRDNKVVISPPSCDNKCNGCTPCDLVSVPVSSAGSSYTIYPENIDLAGQGMRKTFCKSLLPYAVWARNISQEMGQENSHAGAFMIGDGKLLTNAHCVEHGTHVTEELEKMVKKFQALEVTIENKILTLKEGTIRNDFLSPSYEITRELVMISSKSSNPIDVTEELEKMVKKFQALEVTIENKVMHEESELEEPITKNMKKHMWNIREEAHEIGQCELDNLLNAFAGDMVTYYEDPRKLQSLLHFVDQPQQTILSINWFPHNKNN